MCLAIPAQITEIFDNGMAKAAVGGIVKDVSLALTEDINVGDYVIVHVGFVLSRLDPDEAQETLALFAEAGALELRAEEELTR
ncbi:MAG: HypC/HybG/HupF family hydrogenase formation chaperone [Rhodospirillales bacterium]|nr:HypC/HybG/HupF family hydrogenase formation chaperone [Rhodospirillales bacterium]